MKIDGRRFYRAALFLLAVIFTANVWADNLLDNGDFREGKNHWQDYFNGADLHSRDGIHFIRLTNPTGSGIYGLYQDVVFDEPYQATLRLSGRTRQHGPVRFGPDFPFYYGCRLDCELIDGSSFSELDLAIRPAEQAGWQTFAKEWQPPLPVKKVRVYVLFWNLSGEVDFTDLALETPPPRFVYCQAAANLFGPGSLEVRAYSPEAADWRAELLQGTKVLAASQGSGPVRLSLPADPERAGLTEYQLRLTGSNPQGALQFTESQTVHPVPASRPAPSFIAWLQNSMRRVYPSSLPDSADPAAGRLLAAGNEYESFQVALLAAPGRAPEPVRVEITAPADDAGNSLPPDCVKTYQVACVPVPRQLLHPAETESIPDWSPDVLLEPESLSLEPGWAQSLWVCCHIPAGTPAGNYHGTVKLSDGDTAIEIPFSIAVQPFTLPARPSFRTAFFNLSRFADHAYYRTLYPTLDFAALDARQDQFFIDHRLSPVFFWDHVPDFRQDIEPWLDEINAFCLASLSTFAPEVSGEPPSQAALEHFKRQLQEKVGPLIEQCRAAGILERGFFYGFDEMSRDKFPAIQAYVAAARELYPQIPFVSTLRCALTAEAARAVGVDELVVFWPRCRRDQIEPIQAAGVPVWGYVMASLPDQFPQFNLHSPLLESRSIFWQCWNEQLAGLLYWGVNIWSGTSLTDRNPPGRRNDRPVRHGDGPRINWYVNNNVADFLHGDGRLSYPGPDGEALDSVRLMNIRDGLEDYEYLKLHAERFGEARTRQLVKAVTTDIDEFTRDPAVLRRIRAEIAAELNQ